MCYLENRPDHVSGSGRANRNPTFFFVGPRPMHGPMAHGTTQRPNKGGRWPLHLATPCSLLLRLAMLGRAWMPAAAPEHILSMVGDPPLLPGPSWPCMAAHCRPWPRTLI